MTETLGRLRAGPASAPPGAQPLRARPGTHPNVVLAVIAVGAVATIGLWWRDTESITGLGDWLTNAGRVTGLLAGYGMVVLVGLMARLPPVERGVGADTLARWHAMGGRYVVSLVVAHALLIVWGYSVTAHTNVVHETSTLILSYPDVLMATVAGLLFVGVGLVSARAARRRMRYETWYYLHFYTYLAVALAFSHQFASGAEFIDNLAARVAWSTLYIAVGAAIFWYRFVVPTYQAWRHQLRVEAVQVEGPGVVSVIVRGRHLSELRAVSGQFFRWRFLTRELWWACNPYSLSAEPHGDRLRITAKNLGAHSASLTSLRPGTRVVAEGPYGAMTIARVRHRQVLLIAGGIGVTPLRALYETLSAGGHVVTTIYRTSRAEDVIFRDELLGLAQARGERLYLVTGRRHELGYDPLSTQVLLANVPDLRRHDVYICGPAEMAGAVIANLRAAKVPRRQIHHESFEF